MEEVQPLGEDRRDHLGQLELAQRSQGPAPTQEHLDRLELLARDRHPTRQPLHLLDRRRRMQIERRGHPTRILDDHDRARDHVTEPTKHRIARDHDQPDRIAEGQEVGRPQQVAQDRVEHRQRATILPDHPQPQRSLARRAPAPDRLEEHVVEPVEQEDRDQRRAGRHPVEADADLDQLQDQHDHEHDARPDHGVDQVGDRSSTRARQGVVEAHVLRSFDLGRGVDRPNRLRGIHRDAQSRRDGGCGQLVLAVRSAANASHSGGRASS